MRRIAKIIAVNIALLFAAFLAVELAFGTWLSGDPLDRVNIQRGIDFNLDARSLYPGGTVFAYRRNRWGFRGPDVDPATIDILTMGGSTTNQIYLPEEATWQAAMERRLRETGHPMTVANAGMEGQSTVGHLYSMEAWFPHVPGLKPKYILAYVGINDTVIGSTIDRLAFASTNRWIRYNSALIRLAKTIEGNVLARVERMTHFPVDFEQARWTERPAYPDNRAARPDSDPLAYGARLKELVGRIRAFGSQPILVTQIRGDSRIVSGQVMGLATESGMNGVDQRRLLDTYNEVTRTICATEKVACIDVARAIDYEIGDFYDVIHNSPRGAERIGRYIADQIARIDR
jgi:hypothetical protein